VSGKAAPGAVDVLQLANDEHFEYTPGLLPEPPLHDDRVLARRDLRAMVHAGLRRQQGKKRGTFYEADAPLVDIRTRVRADRRPLDASLLFATAASTVG